jgi:hypothetical protein
MTCDEFLQILDTRPKSDLPLDAAWAHHANVCPSCALALRIERSLLDAPSWTPEPALSPDRRVRILAEARLSQMYLPSPLRLLEESAITALAAAAILVTSILFLPEILAGLLPENFKSWVLPSLAPVLDFIGKLSSEFAPLMKHPAGVGVALLMAFAVCLAGVMSLRVLNPHPSVL